MAFLPPDASNDASPARELSAAEEILGGLTRRPAPRDVTIGEAPAADGTHPDVVAHRALRRAVFVEEQGLVGGSRNDLDDTDTDPRAVVLLARGRARGRAHRRRPGRPRSAGVSNGTFLTPDARAVPLTHRRRARPSGVDRSSLAACPRLRAASDSGSTPSAPSAG